MDFTFTEDQMLFRESVKGFFCNEITPEVIREQWDSETGRSEQMWNQLVELGLPAMTVPEALGGLGMNELDFVLLAQESGYAGLPEPLVENVMVAVPLLASLPADQDQLKEEWLSKVATGEAKLAVGHQGNPLVADAHVADLLLLQHGDKVHAVPRDQVQLIANPSVDPSRQLFKVEWTPSPDTCVASGEQGQAIWSATFNRGALAVAAQQLGLAKRVVDLAVDYTYERKQFGKPVGSFQAVKHHMANVAVQIEFAKAPMDRAAYALAHGISTAAMNVSHAKIVTSEAALLGAKNAIQAHGAMGYTWEVDLHIYMKRAWALDAAYGDRGFHKARVKEFILADGALLGAGNTFLG